MAKWNSAANLDNLIGLAAMLHVRIDDILVIDNTVA